MKAENLYDLKEFIEDVVIQVENDIISKEDAWNAVNYRFTVLKSVRKKLRRKNKTLMNLDAKKLKFGLDKFQKKIKKNYIQ